MIFPIFLYQISAYLPRRTCQNMSFCRDNIDLQTNFRILKDTINFKNHIFSSNLFEENTNTTLKFSIYHISNSGFRFRIDPIEKESFNRYDISKESVIINSEYINNKDFSTHTKYDNYSLLSGFGALTAEIFYDPFYVEIKNSNQLILTVNKNRHLTFNQHGKQSKPEIYDGFIDPIKNGLTSVSCDFEFPEFVYISGFGSRSGKMNLDDGLFRMFNHGGFSNYGTIPFFIAHSITIMLSVFWMNPSDTFVSIETIQSKSGDNDEKLRKKRRVKFLSECGFVDFVINIGKFDQLIESYTDLTGKPLMPPLFAFGYHQSHWGYKMQEDVESIIDKLDLAKIPFDCFWLDIDHLEDQMPFTVDKNRFPNMNGLIEKLRKQGRFLVRITDPHISINQDLAKEGLKKNYFVLQVDQNKDSGLNSNLAPFLGDCWPGESMWPDFLNNEVVDWWASKFDSETFPDNVFIWNDMNEPSVFRSIDGSFPKHLMHGIFYEDRDVHNIYGLLNTYGTYKGLIKRNSNQRPFILSRSHFSGSQKFVWLWSGDNVASWDDLESSLAHIVNFGICGFPFVGADVGGFFGDPSKRLLFRWFQAASWIYPFFREHSHIDSGPREPYLFGDDIKQTVRDRYKLLPLFYTAAKRSNLTGIPIVKPLWSEFPDFPLMHQIQNQLLVAETIIVCPVVTKSIDNDRRMEVAVPPGSWFDFYDGKQLTHQNRFIGVSEKVPVFIRGGRIFLTYSDIGTTANTTIRMPLTMHVALDHNGRASGDVYFDDGHSYDYIQGEYFEKHYSFIRGILKMRTQSHFKEVVPDFVNGLYIDKIIIYGTSVLKKKLKLDFEGKIHKLQNDMIVIDEVMFNMLGDFTLFDGVKDSGVKVRNIVFKVILIGFAFSLFLPLVFHLLPVCSDKNKHRKHSSEESLIGRRQFGVQSSLDSDFDSDSFSF